MAFGAVFDAVKPMAAGGRLAFRTGKAVVGRERLGVGYCCERGARKNAGEDG
jgi:hypothetical protein